ncbi:MAG: aspartate-semialdehyde dehydrogenase [Eubacteriales bacterium]|nr:aspartate-semialdehyde dehydrogenase [Eubacteriales bacterium]
MKNLKIGILGATGAVGQQMITVLEERNFPVEELRLFASARSAGTKISAFGKEWTVEETDAGRFRGLDLMLGAAENNIAEKYLPLAAEMGVQVVDNSSAFRLDPEIPLVIPEVNPEDVKLSKGLIANPNCATIIALTAVMPLHKAAHIKRMIVSTYQAVSGAGKEGIDELENEVKELAEGKPVQEPRIFQYQIAYNLIPQIGGFNELGYSSEEMKMQNEGRKMLHDEKLLVNCTCVRVPIIRSHSESITLEFDKEITPEEAKELLKNAPGVKLYDEPDEKIYPMPLLTSDQDLVYVGRVRRDLSAPAEIYNKSLTLFCCADQVRKGAATNAVQIAELLFR